MTGRGAVPEVIYEVSSLLCVLYLYVYGSDSLIDHLLTLETSCSDQLESAVMLVLIGKLRSSRTEQNCSIEPTNVTSQL